MSDEQSASDSGALTALSMGFVFLASAILGVVTVLDFAVVAAFPMGRFIAHWWGFPASILFR
jgi:hypothetical protein